MTSRGTAFGLLLLGAVTMLITAGLPWYDAGHGVTVNGNDVSGGLSQALAAVVLAGTLLMLTLRATGRRVVAVVLALSAVGAGFTAFQRPSEQEVLAELRKRTLTDVVALQATGGSYGYLAGCVLVLAGAVLVCSYAGRWPQRAARFERDAGSAEPAAASATRATTDPEDQAALWKAIDAGEDPTDGSEDDSPGRPG